MQCRLPIHEEAEESKRCLFNRNLENYGPQPLSLKLDYFLTGSNQTKRFKMLKLKLLMNHRLTKVFKGQQLNPNLNSFTNVNKKPTYSILISIGNNCSPQHGKQFNRSKDAFTRDQINSIEFRQAQLNLFECGTKP